MASGPDLVFNLEGDEEKSGVGGSLFRRPLSANDWVALFAGAISARKPSTNADGSLEFDRKLPAMIDDRSAVATDQLVVTAQPCE